MTTDLVNLGTIKNLIFDLGGVIIDLSVEKTVLEFSQLTGLPPREVEKAYLQHPLFIQYEKGLISSDQFRLGLRQVFSLTALDAEIDRCWNAMLVELPDIKLHLLGSLKQDYRTSVLSNTNEIHLEYVNRVMLHGGLLDDYFHASHYSHLMNLRKPETEIYQQVLSENNFDTSDTLFLDDNIHNLEAAAALGIKTLHIGHPSEVLTLFKQYV
jgi:glucose-1-phosphatase